MTKFFTWVSSLPPEQSWGLFAFVCIVMAIVPFFDYFKRIVLILFRNEKAEITDFSWRVGKDHLLFTKPGKHYYLRSNGKQFILEGGKIFINWKVKGSYRVDLLPIKRNIKGNTVGIIARQNMTEFTLVAYTLKGKLEQKINLDPRLFRKINTLNISQEKHFRQKLQEKTTTSFVNSSWMSGKYTLERLKPLPSVLTKKLQNIENRINYKKRIRHLKNWSSRDYASKVKSYANQRHLPMYAFHPKRYNQNLGTNKSEQLIS
jgi:hypothetical protein